MRHFADRSKGAFELSEQFEAHLKQRDGWEIITPANLAVITFRRNPSRDLDEKKLDQLNQHLSDRIIAEGRAMLATTIVNDQTVLRMCLINPRTSMDDLQATLDDLEKYAAKLESDIV